MKPDERREQMIATTIKCLARYGAQGTGVRRICREMGVAPSLPSYFFDGRAALLVAAYNSLSKRYFAEIDRIAGLPWPDARARIQAMVRGYLAREWLNDEVVGAYLALWALSRTEPRLMTAFTRLSREWRSLMRRALDPLVKEAGVDINTGLVADGLIILLDGLWLERALNPARLSSARALALCWAWLDGAFGRPIGPTNSKGIRR